MFCAIFPMDLNSTYDSAFFLTLMSNFFTLLGPLKLNFAKMAQEGEHAYNENVLVLNFATTKGSALSSFKIPAF